MRPVRLLLVVFLLLFRPAGSVGSTLTNIHHLFLVLMENVTWSEIKGSTNAPFINTVLLPMSSYCDNFFTVPNTTGSLPQYLWLEAGTNFGINDSADPAAHHINSTNHLVRQLEAAGIQWKTYQENISGSTCPTASTGLYAAFHNAFVYFDDIYLNPVNCSNHVRPYPELWRDLTNNSLPQYAFITPNLCDDMHNATGCATPSRVRNGDNWLAAEIPKILNSQPYQQDGAIIITWDEGTGGAAGPFGTILLSPWAKSAGYHNTNRFDHAATLRTLQEIFSVRPFLGAAAKASSLEDLFLPDLQLTQPQLSSEGFSFLATGAVPGKTLWLERSAELQNWTPVLTNTATTNTLLFRDPAAINGNSSYYRVRSSP